MAARVAQGLGAALLIPSSLALLHAAFADRAGRAQAIGVWGAVGGVAAAAGPVLPLGLLGRPALAAGTVVGLLLNLGFYGQLFVVGLCLQQVRGDPPATAGLLLLAETGMVTVSSATSGRLAARVAPRRPLLVGLLAGPAGLATAGPVAGDSLLAGLLALTGFGMAFAMTAATAAVVDAAPPERVGVAATVLSTARQVGSLLGVALLGALLTTGHGFRSGMARGLLLASGAFLLGGLLAARVIGPRPPAGR